MSGSTKRRRPPSGTGTSASAFAVTSLTRPASSCVLQVGTPPAAAASPSAAATVVKKRLPSFVWGMRFVVLLLGYWALLNLFDSLQKWELLTGPPMPASQSAAASGAAMGSTTNTTKSGLDLAGDSEIASGVPIRLYLAVLGLSAWLFHHLEDDQRIHVVPIVCFPLLLVVYPWHAPAFVIEFIDIATTGTDSTVFWVHNPPLPLRLAYLKLCMWSGFLYQVLHRVRSVQNIGESVQSFSFDVAHASFYCLIVMGLVCAFVNAPLPSVLFGARLLVFVSLAAFSFKTTKPQNGIGVAMLAFLALPEIAEWWTPWLPALALVLVCFGVALLLLNEQHTNILYGSILLLLFHFRHDGVMHLLSAFDSDDWLSHIADTCDVYCRLQLVLLLAISVIVSPACWKQLKTQTLIFLERNTFLQLAWLRLKAGMRYVELLAKSKTAPVANAMDPRVAEHFHDTYMETDKLHQTTLEHFKAGLDLPIFIHILNDVAVFQHILKPLTLVAPPSFQFDSQDAEQEQALRRLHSAYQQVSSLQKEAQDLLKSVDEWQEWHPQVKGLWTLLPHIRSMVKMDLTVQSLLLYLVGTSWLMTLAVAVVMVGGCVMLLAHAIADHMEQNLEDTEVYKLGLLARQAFVLTSAAEMSEARDKFEKLLKSQVADKLVNQLTFQSAPPAP
jgi:hypothetical protein